MKRAVTLAAVFGLIFLTACGKSHHNAVSSLDKRAVVLYGSVHFGQNSKVYYGEDTRGKSYVIQKSRYDLDFSDGNTHFVKVSMSGGEWEIEEVLPVQFQL